MPSIVIVGRPNVGKSCFFNRLIRQRKSIVHDQPGVTRDIVMAEVGDWIFMDTGGIGMKTANTPAAIQAAVEEQVELALRAADRILWVVDGQEGCLPLDLYIGDKLRKFFDKTTLIVNKIDTDAHISFVHPFLKLGFKPTLAVSSEHNRGIDVVREHLERALGGKPQKKEIVTHDCVKMCFIGRPNVGKSSIVNAVLNNERCVVSEVAGTTRDTTETPFTYTFGDKTRHFVLVDTAGVYKHPRESVEYFSSVRMRSSMEKADVVILVLDAREGVTDQDKRLAGEALEAGRALIVAVNKWDLAAYGIRSGKVHGYDNLKSFGKAFEEALYKQLFFLPNSPCVYISALEKTGLNQLMDVAWKVAAKQDKNIQTAKINAILGTLIQKNPPKAVDGKKFKIYYGLQVANRPFTFKVFCNQTNALLDSYQRYLEKGMYDTLAIAGCPIKFSFIGKPGRKKK